MKGLVASGLMHSSLEQAVRVQAFNGQQHQLRFFSMFSQFIISVNSLMPPGPQFNVVQALLSVQTKKQKSQHCLGEEGGKCVQDPQKSNFTAKCNTFVAHCWLGSLCCVLGQDTLLSQYLSLPRCVDGMAGTNKLIVRVNPVMDQHPIQGGVEIFLFLMLLKLG